MNKVFALTATALAAVPTLAADSLTLNDWTDDVKKALVVYDNEDTFVQKVSLAFRQQWQMASLQPNGSNGLHLKDGATPYNHEFRRSWIGVNVHMDTDTQFHSYVRIGGLPSRSSYSGGRTKRNFTYAGFYDIWLKQNIHAVKGLSVKVGKYAPKLTSELCISNANMPCIERSIVTNQFGLDTNWGVEVEYVSPDKKNSFFIELAANDRAANSKNRDHSDVYDDWDGFNGEFGWEDKCFVIIGGKHLYDVTEEGYQALSFQYAHDFNNAYHGRRKPGANNAGIAFKDALSLGYEMMHNKWTFHANLVGAFEQQAGNGTNNIGWVLMPVYSVHPQVDLVFRYSGLTGKDACKLSGDRYITRQSTAPSWVDSLHAFYFGVDLYASPKNKHAAKIMFGAEYTTARDGGKDVYNGWEYITALRMNF